MSSLSTLAVMLGNGCLAFKAKWQLGNKLKINIPSQISLFQLNNIKVLVIKRLTKQRLFPTGEERHNTCFLEY